MLRRTHRSPIALTLLLAWALASSCGQLPDPAKTPPTPECKDDVKMALCGVQNPTLMRFATVRGTEYVSWDQVTRLKISIMDGPSRTFSGPDSFSALSKLNLFNPSRRGLPAALLTGTITLHFKKSDEPEERERNLVILNSRWISDSAFPEVTYLPQEPIDSNWLINQP